MTTQTYKLYFLYEKQNGKVFYIGITKVSLKRRLYQHIYNALQKTKSGEYKNQYHQPRKIRKLIEDQIEFDIDLLLTFSTLEEANIFEMKYIQWAKKMGFILSNSTEGGDGTKGNLHSEEWKKLHSEKMKLIMPKQWQTDESKQKTIRKVQQTRKLNNILVGANNHCFGKFGKKSSSKQTRISIYN